MSYESDGVGITAERQGHDKWECKGIKELSEGGGGIKTQT